LRIREIESGLWPTPVASDLGVRKKMYGQGGTALSLAASTWPTPTAHNAKEGGYPSEHGRNTATLTAQAAGGVPTQPMTLNPEWVEWLQGWPRGWSDLRPLGTDKCQS